MAPPPDLPIWLALLERCKGQLFHMWHARGVWREIRDALDTNVTFPQPPYVFSLFTEWYAASQAVAVRRQSYHSQGQETIAQLLRKMENANHTLRRTWFKTLYQAPGDRYWMAAADETFDVFAGPGGTTLSKAWCAKERMDLATAVAPVKQYVDQHVAHLDPSLGAIPTFSDLDAAIDHLGGLLQRVVQLLTSHHLAEVEPVSQFPWQWDLTVPWMRGPGGLARPGPATEP